MELVSVVDAHFIMALSQDRVCSIIILDHVRFKNMPLNKSWHDYNESLIERGRILMDIISRIF